MKYFKYLTLTSRKKRSPRHGFTLVEMLVSMGIFLTFTTISLGIFTSTVRAQRKSLAINRVQREAQFVMEFLSKIVRTSDIDYPAYPGSTIPSPATTQLILRDANNNQFNLIYKSDIKAITVSVNGGPAQRLSSSSIAITDMNFYITPPTSPFPGGGTPPTSQPRATMVMRFTYAAAGQSANLLVQQTVPQRSVGY